MQPDQGRPLLSADEERQLARSIEVGVLASHLLATGERPLDATDAELGELVRAGRVAWEHFWLANLRLVQKLASQEARRSGLPLEDLFQEGCVALAGALQRFDPDRGRFLTYAAGRIGRHLSHSAAARLGALGLPVSQAVALRRARGVRAELTQARQQEVGLGELADALGCPEGQVRRLFEHREPIGLIAPETIGAGDADGVDPDRAILADQLRREVARLRPELAEVVRLRFGIGQENPLDLGELAAHLGVSVSTARRRELEAIAALRHRLDLCGIGLDALAG